MDSPANTTGLPAPHGAYGPQPQTPVLLQRLNQWKDGDPSPGACALFPQVPLLNTLQFTVSSWHGCPDEARGFSFSPVSYPTLCSRQTVPGVRHLTGFCDSEPFPRRPFSSGSTCPRSVHSHPTAFSLLPHPRLEVSVPHGNILPSVT